ncbi:hypothetical protein FRC01_013909 [Tulasnella sp. 417]|nr:hypothetical protein FRC01_013909 [Tulasnella sp. 417]
MSTNVNTTLAVGAVVTAAKPVDNLRTKSGTDSKSSTPANHEFDFVIVGGGTATMVLAHRLTERSDVNVLVIEAGRSSRASRIPGSLFQLNARNANGRTGPPLRKDVIIVNSSGPEQNFRRMLERKRHDVQLGFSPREGAEGAEGICKRSRRSFLTKTYLAPTKERGKTGPVKIGYFGFFTTWGRAFILTCEAISIPHVPDINTSKGMFLCHRGDLVAAYLTLEVLARPNLKVVCGAQVTKIRFNDAKRAIGVEFGEKKDGPIYVAGARKEVILPAGPINTPQILLSGIRPQSELSKHSIPVIQHLPGVGQNLADHIVFNSCFPTRPGYSAGRYYTPKNFGEQLSQLGAIAQSFDQGKGADDDQRAAVDGGEGDVLEDSTSGEGARDVEVMVAPMVWRDHGHKKFDVPEAITITTSVLRPTSKGTVTLKSADPWDKPLIDPCYLATKHDVDILVRSVKLAYQLTNTEPLKSAIDQTVKHPLLDHDLSSKSNAEIEDVIRSRAETGYHPSCTARMAPLEDGGVVDARLRVYGVQGLRAVDASVQPEIVSGHTTGPTIAIAERAADLIKEDLVK